MANLELGLKLAFQLGNLRPQVGAQVIKDIDLSDLETGKGFFELKFLQENLQMSGGEDVELQIDLLGGETFQRVQWASNF